MVEFDDDFEPAVSCAHLAGVTEHPLRIAPRHAERVQVGAPELRRHAPRQRQGLEILERFKEQGESAKTADRTELQKLLQYCRTHKGKVHFVVAAS